MCWLGQDCRCCNFIEKETPTQVCYYSGCSNVVLTLSLGWYDAVTWGNIKSTLGKLCESQGWNLQRRTTSNRRCLLNVDINSVGQCRNNVALFKVEFHSVGQLRNNILNMTISKKNKIMSVSLKSNSFKIEYAKLKFLTNISYYSSLYSPLQQQDVEWDLQGRRNS